MKKNIGVIVFSGLILGFLLFGRPLSLHAQNAPVTSAAIVSNAVAGQQVVVPVTVTGFNNIGSITLSMDYDPSKLQFVSASANPAFTGSPIVGDNFIGNGIRRLVLSWFGDGFSLPDGSYLVNYTFTYLTGTAELVWFDMGPSCLYSDDNAIILNDMPTSEYYINGLVQSQVDKQLQLGVFLEGLYNTGTHKMEFARNASSNQYPGTTVEQITVELHNAADYSNIVFIANDVNLDENGSASVTVPLAVNGSYYITIKHRNSIETVSSIPVLFSGATITYSFNDVSKAFGSNLKQVSDGAWVIYSGDVNQDGIIDSGDLIPIDNDAASFLTGYRVTDINGDGLVDNSDLIFPVVNAGNFIEKVTP